MNDRIKVKLMDKNRLSGIFSRWFVTHTVHKFNIGKLFRLSQIWNIDIPYIVCYPTWCCFILCTEVRMRVATGIRSFVSKFELNTSLDAKIAKEFDLNKRQSKRAKIQYEKKQTNKIFPLTRSDLSQHVHDTMECYIKPTPSSHQPTVIQFL